MRYNIIGSQLITCHCPSRFGLGGIAFKANNIPLLQICQVENLAPDIVHFVGEGSFHHGPSTVPVFNLFFYTYIIFTNCTKQHPDINLVPWWHKPFSVNKYLLVTLCHIFWFLICFWFSVFKVVWKWKENAFRGLCWRLKRTMWFK